MNSMHSLIKCLTSLSFRNRFTAFSCLSLVIAFWIIVTSSHISCFLFILNIKLIRSKFRSTQSFTSIGCSRTYMCSGLKLGSNFTMLVSVIPSVWRIHEYILSTNPISEAYFFSMLYVDPYPHLVELRISSRHKVLLNNLGRFFRAFKDRQPSPPRSVSEICV